MSHCAVGQVARVSWRTHRELFTNYTSRCLFTISLCLSLLKKDALFNNTSFVVSLGINWENDRRRISNSRSSTSNNKTWRAKEIVQTRWHLLKWVSSHQFYIEREQNEVDEIKKLTKTQLSEFFNTHICVESKKRRKLSTYIYPTDMNAELNKETIKVRRCFLKFNI